MKNIAINPTAMTNIAIIDGFKITLALANTKQPQWSNGKHNHYKVRISKGRKSLSFDYFGSINQAERGIHPTIADALACFAMDAFCGKLSFEDFCFDMGGSTDSMKDLKAWKSCVKFAKDAERLGISEEVLEVWGTEE